MNTMRKKIAGIVSLIALSATTPVHAALTSVSGIQAGAPPVLTEVTATGAATDVAVSLANGFPIWYKDSNNLKLQLCLDSTAVKQSDGTTFEPCLTAQPVHSAPISFPNNFGAEAFYWAAVAFDNLLSSNVNGTPTPWSALLVMAQEAGFFNFGTEGNQAVFSRIRLRIKVPVPGTYRVTHPYGTRDYVVADFAAGDNRDINQTQDLGLFIDPNNLAIHDTFLTSLSDRPADQLPLPAFPQPTPPSVSAAPNGIVDASGKSVGPFLTSASGTVTATSGAIYLSDPGTDLVPKTVAINNGPFGNTFSIELIGDAAGNIGTIPAGVILNPGNGTQTVSINRFQLVGKLFNDGPNTPPAVGPVNVATATNTPVSIDVAPFVEDFVSGTNVHGADPQAISVYVSPTDIRRSFSYTTTKGGTVQRFVNTATGKSTFIYTPATDFAGLDSFQYVAQDTGGLISAPATISVMVENLAVAGAGAVYRPKFGKWRITGTSSIKDNNIVSLATDPTAVLSGTNVVPAVSSQAKGTASVIAGRDSIKYFVNIAPLPSSSVTSIHINQGVVGSNGPVLFVLYDSQNGPLSLPLTGQVTLSHLILRPEIGINSFLDAVNEMLRGNAYVNVITTTNSSGEIRGQLLGRTLGNTAVTSDGSWKFSKKTMVNPQGVRGVNAVSSSGVRLLGIPLSIR